MSWYGELPKRWGAASVFALFDENTRINSNLETKTALQFRFGEIVRKNISETEVNLKRYTLVNPNDIMINGLNLNYDFVTQRVAMVKETGAITPAYISLRPKNIISPQYGCYLLKVMDEQKLFNGMGTGIRLTLGYSEFKKIHLPYPPRDEQDQIVRYLDWKVSGVNGLINAKRKQIALLGEQKRAVVNEAVTRGDKKVRLKQIFKIFNGATPKSEDLNYWNGDIYWITPIDLSKTTMYIENSIRKITKLGFYSCPTSLIPENNIVLATRAPIGNVRINKVDLCTNQGCKSLVLIDKNNSVEFFFYVLDSLKKYLQSLGDGATFTELSNAKLSNVLIPLPPLDEQCGNIDKIIAKLNEEIALFSEYRTRLISDVVTGRLDVRGVVVPEFEAVGDVLVNNNSDESENEINESEE